MIDDYQGLLRISFQTAIILLILLLFFRKHVLSVFDPLFFYLITQAFSIELAFITIEKTPYLISFLGCQCCFTAGFLVFGGKPLKKGEIISNILLKPNLTTLSAIKLFAILTCFMIVLANIYLVLKVGIALFADDPSAAKGENFASGGGLGIIRRINWGLLYLCAFLLYYLALYKKSFFYTLLFLTLIAIAVFSGSKGALLYFIMLIPLVSMFTDVKKLIMFKWINLSKYILLAGGVALALAIIITGTDKSIDEAVFSLGSRFLFFGDAMLYYYDDFSIKHFSYLNLTDFIYREANPILGFFRIVQYQRAFGFDLVEYKFSFYEDSVFGPNVPYYIGGHIFFGVVGALFYSFAIGGVVGWVRSWLYKLLRAQRTIITTLLIIHLNLVIYNLPQDSQLFINVMFDTFFQAVPIYLLTYFILKKGLLNKVATPLLRI